MKREQMDTLNNLLLKARKEINTKNVKYDKNGIPCSVALDTSLHSQIKKFPPVRLRVVRSGNKKMTK